MAAEQRGAVAEAKGSVRRQWRCRRLVGRWINGVVTTEPGVELGFVRASSRGRQSLPASDRRRNTPQPSSDQEARTRDCQLGGPNVPPPFWSFRFI
jgi:hypothetical protein